MQKAKSLSINVTANLVNQVGSVLFPLITFPYVSRVLRPEGLGRVSFAEAVVQYFSLLATLGIPLYGVRESAKRRDDASALSTLAAELFSLNVLMTALAMAAFSAFMLLSRKAHSDPALLWICALPLLFAPLGFNWLLGGLEEYVYITVRTLVIRVLVVAAVFLFIHTQEDLRIYALITSLNVAAVGLLNLVLVRKHVSLRNVDWGAWNVRKHIRPVLLVFSLAGVVSIYTSLDKVILGYLSNDIQVGLYSAADRVVKAVVMAVTSVGIVLLPRVSYYIHSGRLSEYASLTTTTLRFISFISFPAAAGLIAVAGPLVLLLSGREFEPAVPLVQIMGLNVLFIAVGNIMGYQVLYPQGKERLLLISAALGAICNLGLNCLLIPRWQALGAAVATLITELCVTSARIVLSRAHSHLIWPIGSMLKYAAAALSMGAVVALLGPVLPRPALCLPLSIGVGAAFYVVVLWMLKDSLLPVIRGRLAVGVVAAARATRMET